MVVLGLPTAAFLVHCVEQSLIVAPFTAAAVLSGLFLAKLPVWAKKCFLVLGKHSTNIWLVHMFFYHRLFPGFVFTAEYPVLILLLMLAICFVVSAVIDWFYRPVLALLERRPNGE
jgi:fucose 4-O-acetylase-like acetyltransferase